MSLLDSIRHLATEDGDCLIWRGACCSGHPSMRKNGRNVLVRRELYADTHGPIKKGAILRVTCGHLRCIEPSHAKLTTYRGVAVECGALGLMSGVVRSARIAATKRAGPQAKVSDADVRAIRESDETGAALAKRYRISEGMVSKYRLGKCRKDHVSPWAGLTT